MNTLQKILTIAAFGLTTISSPAQAQDAGCDAENNNITVTYKATLTGDIGQRAKKHILDLTANGFKEEPWESRMELFRRDFGSVENPQDKSDAFKPAVGFVEHASDETKKACVIYLYRDKNANNQQDIGMQVREDAQEKELLCIPHNILFDERNAPYVQACDVYVGAFEKIFSYRLFVPAEPDMLKKYEYAKKVYGAKQQNDMRQCLVKAAAQGIKRHEEELAISTEGDAMISAFQKRFGSLDAPVADNSYGVEVFKLGELWYSFLFIDANKNNQFDPGESLLNLIQTNDAITPYSTACAIPPDKGVITLDDTVNQLEQDKEYDKAAEMFEKIGAQNQGAGKEKEARDAYLRASLNYEKAGKYALAGSAAEKAGKPELAADAYLKGGLHQKAGRALAKAGLLEKAIEAYKQGGLNPPQSIDINSHGGYSSVGRLLTLYVGALDETGISRAGVYEDGKEIKSFNRFAGFNLVDIEKTAPGTHVYQFEVEDKEGNLLRSKHLKIEFSGAIIDRIPTARVSDWTKIEPRKIGVFANDSGDNQGLSKLILYEDGTEIESWTNEGKVLFKSFNAEKSKPGKHTYQLEVTDLGGHTVKSEPITIEFGGLEKKASENIKTIKQ